MPSVSETPTRISPVSSLASRYISRRSSESQSVITTRRFSSSSASRSGSNVPSINEASDGGSACARRSVRAVSIINATVSARSPTSEKHSSAIHPGTCARSQPHTASSRGAINRFSLRPVRKKSAQAASAGGASAKYDCIAATFALVEVVASSAS